MDVAIDVAWRKFRESLGLLSSPRLALRWDQGPYAISAHALWEAGAAGLFYNLVAVINQAVGRRLGDQTPRTQKGRLEWVVEVAPAEDRDALGRLLELHDRIYGERAVDASDLAAIAPEYRDDYVRTAMRAGRRVPPLPERTLAPSIDAIERLLLSWGFIDRVPAFTTSTTVAWKYRSENKIAAPGPEHFGVLHTVTDDEGNEASAFTALPLDPEEIVLDWEPGLKDLEATVARWEGFARGATNKTEAVLADQADANRYGSYVRKELETLDGEIAAFPSVLAKAPDEHRGRVEGLALRLTTVRDHLVALSERLKAIE
jgi:hypothetical protein